LHQILVLHGPNLNLLGSREPGLYSTTSLEEINNKLGMQAAKLDLQLACKQTNAEHEMIDMIHKAKTDGCSAMILNAAAWTHTSLAIRDALLAVQLPFIEVHISNIYARESFRHKSYLSDIASGVITGVGPLGYELALTALVNILNYKTQTE
jgi:3-dehydroquinate dehydratase-2